MRVLSCGVHDWLRPLKSNEAMRLSTRRLVVSTVTLAASLGMSACAEDEPLSPPGQVQDDGGNDQNDSGDDRGNDQNDDDKGDDDKDDK